ncbi:MAG: NADH-quinone oxidoreductase subunit C [Planctomycetota bacterium]
MSALEFAAIAARVRAVSPAVEARVSENGQPWLLVPAADIQAVGTFLRDETDLDFASLMDLSGWDQLTYPPLPVKAAAPAKPAAAGAPAAPVAPAKPEIPALPTDVIVVIYCLHSLGHRHKVTLKVLAPRNACAVPTVSAIWPAAIYFEREAWDLLGVDFTGHPSLRRIMCPDDWVGHGLRKDYRYPADYHGISHLREGQRFAEPAAPAAPATGAAS